MKSPTNAHPKYAPVFLTAMVAMVAARWHCPATTFVVYKNTDDGSVGTLRYAIKENNLLGGGSTILFSNTVTGTISLSGSELGITNNVTIIGPGANVLAISGGNSSRVFVSANGTNSISGLTIANGSAYGPNANGGGIIVLGGGLTLTTCTFTNNNANVGNGGGGIYLANGSLAVSNCTIVGNQALNGGGIFQNGGSATIYYSTINGNSVSGSYGGGIREALGTLSLFGCTITANTAATGAGMTQVGGTSIIRSCTIIGNHATTGGGIYCPGGISVGDTIVAGNSAPNYPDCYGTFSSVGYNLIGAGDGSSGFNNFGDQVGTSASPINPLLGALQDNGGPTLTMAPLPGSPAIDQGVWEDGITSDQRGQPRLFDFPNIPNAIEFGDGSDIGAFEVEPPSLNIQQIGNAAVMSWPNYYGNFSLQTNGSVAAASSWGNAPGTPVAIGTQYYFTNSPVSGVKFFRLKSN